MLIDIHRAASMLCLPEGATAKLLDRLRVQPIDFGVGRGLGKRWLEDDVKKAVLSLIHTPQVRKGGKKKAQQSLVDMNAKQFVQEIGG